MKWAIFQGAFQQVKEMICEEDLLVDTFGKMILNLRENKNLQREFVDQLKKICITNSHSRPESGHRSSRSPGSP